MALDSGAQGIVVPMVNTAEEARKVVRFARFPPLGDRGVGGFLPHIGFAATRAEYVANANSQILVAIQIETKQAVDNIDAILQVEGIDVVFVGPSDLHMSLGLPLKSWSDEPSFQAAIQTVKDACAKRGLPLGIYSRDAAGARKRIEEEGFRFVGIGSDAMALLTRAGDEASVARGEAPPAAGWADTFKGVGL
jgi:4-hydroxy-2-oxoheptanedioate aldolase